VFVIILQHLWSFLVVIFHFATIWHIQNFIVNLDTMPLTSTDSWIKKNEGGGVRHVPLSLIHKGGFHYYFFYLKKGGDPFSN
jgi:hypothetical protein